MVDTMAWEDFRKESHLSCREGTEEKTDVVG